MQRIFAILCVALLAGTMGCTKPNVGNTYNPSPESNHGLVVLSLTDDTQFSNYILNFQGLSVQGGGEITLWTFQEPFDWNHPRGRLVALKVRAGDYAFHQIVSQSFGAGGFSIPFQVKPGRVTYMGNVHVQQDRSGLAIDVSDKSSRDLPLFLRRYRNVTREDVDVLISRFERS